MPDYRIRVVLFESEPGVWIGQCLEHDIGAQASSLKDLLYSLQRSLVGYAAICEQRGIGIFSDLPEAPSKYHELWEAATMQVTPLKPISFAPRHPPIVPELRAA